MNTIPNKSQNADTISEIEVPSPLIDLSIYAMPAFATLSVSNLERSRRWYVEGLEFAVLAEIPGPAGDIELIHLRRWRYQDLLLVPAHSSPVPTPQGISLTFSAHGTDLDALVTQAKAIGSGSVGVPSPTPWNTLDVITHDPDGYKLVFTSMLPQKLHDPEFAKRMEQVKQHVQSESSKYTS